MLLYAVFMIIMLITDLIFIIVNKNNKKLKIFQIIINIIMEILIIKINITITKFSILYLINNIINIIIVRNSLNNFSGLIKVIFSFFLILNISILLELTIFNYRSYISISYNSKNMQQLDIKTNLEETNEKGIYKVVNESTYIEILNLNKHVSNFYLDIIDLDLSSYRITPSYTDNSSELYQQLESREVHNKINRSKILNFNLNGKSKKMKFNFTFPMNNKIKINDIILNYKIPVELNVIRLLIVFSIISFIYFFRIKSNLYKIKYIKYKNQILISLILLIIISFSLISTYSIGYYNKNERNIYNNLADSLLEGKTYFKDDNDSEKLLNTLKNPYDTKKRDKVFKEKNQNYLWDCAFYKGHYYSYFGVVPTIMFYIPYKIVTGLDLQTPFIVFIITLVSAILLIILLQQIVSKYFKNLSIGIYLLLSFVLIYCTGLLYFLKMSHHYSLPIVSGLMFTYLGLNFFVSALDSNKNTNCKFVLGSLSLALVAGCRPQLLLGSILIVPILVLYCKENKLTTKEIIKKAICIIIPYVLVAILMMYYNYIRFSSPFDFGANYNLTTNDMTHRGFVFDRIPLGLVMYLFNPINIENVFPYIVATELKTNYLGLTIYEPMYGGVFFSVIITSINLLIFKLKKYINNKLIYRTCISCIICSLIIIIADTEMAGILARYVTDFSWLLVFSSVLIILSLTKNKKLDQNLLIKVVLILVSISIIYQSFYYFVSIIDKFKYNNLRFWLEFYYAFQFWI